MLVRLAAALAAAIAVTGCGGGGAATTKPPAVTGSTAGATQTPAGAGQTPAPTAGGPVGGSIDSSGVAAALTALQALDSWTFQVKAFTKTLGDAAEQDVSGTQRTKPAVAVDAMHHGPTGDFRYIRIGDDIWADLGQGTFYHYTAAGSANLISQYEPFYVASLVAGATATSGDYDLVGEESVNGTAAVHYRMTEEGRRFAAQMVNLQPDQWAGDVWIAKSGGYLVRFAWGPQSVETAGPITGFVYDTTLVNCDCPINPPANATSP